MTMLDILDSTLDSNLDGNSWILESLNPWILESLSPWILESLNLETAFFLNRKVFNYDNFSIASNKQEMHKSLSQITRKYTVKRNNNMDI